MHRPTAVPRIPASASGVSTQRSTPKRSWRPAVARKTPPSLPTSSPMTRTDESRSISTWSASFTASTSRSSATEDPPKLLLVGVLRRRRIGVRMLEHEREIRWRLGLCLSDSRPHELERLRLDLLDERVREDAQAREVPRIPADALVVASLLDPVGVDVDRGIVCGRVRCRAVRQRLDERRAVAGTRAEHRVAGGLVHGQAVGPVAPNARNAVPDR